MAKETAVFIDSVGWIALVHRGDELHHKTVQTYRGLGSVRRITTDAVLIESCNAFSKSSLRPLATTLMEKVKESGKIGVLDVVHVDEELIQRGLEMFKARNDKDWSLTDCISFVVMKEKGNTMALTSDHHFQQAGFEKLI